MRLHLSFRTLGLVVLVLALGLMQPVSTPFCWAQDKSATGATQGSTIDVPVPKGTLDAITAIMTRRSIRDYTQQPVPEELIKILVKAGMCAPSSFNERSPEFIVINDRKILDAIYNLDLKALHIKRTSVAIVVCGNQSKEKFKGRGYWQLNAAAASENILIAAHAMGLGAVWSSIYPFPDRIAAVKKLLNLPEQVIPLNIIPIWYPAEQKPQENRFDQSRLRYNRW
jgi:nitroreductase